jgi:hypothetical protein
VKSFLDHNVVAYVAVFPLLAALLLHQTLHTFASGPRLRRVQHWVGLSVVPLTALFIAVVTARFVVLH